MKFSTHTLVVLAVVAVLATGLTVMAASTSFTNPNHKHNMNNVFGANTIVNNEICLPCHTPHNQPDKSLEALWNHVMPTQSYTLFGTDATKYVGLDMVSKMCLSCHDGSVAIDSYGTWGGINTGTKKLGAGLNDSWGNSTAGYVVGAGGDLKHDHPVGVIYPGWNGTTWTSSRGFKDPSTFAVSGAVSNTYQVIDKTSGSTVTTNVNFSDGTKSITMVGGAMFFGSLTEGGTANIVGCGTCHTPHTATYRFLHIPNVNSQLCLTCHDK